MANATNIKIPLQSLLAKLRTEGFEIGTSTVLDLQRVIANVHNENVVQPADLKFLLSPIICRNKEEQGKFYRIFDEYLNATAEQPIEVSQIIGPKPDLKKWWWVVVPVALLTALVIYYLKPVKSTPVTKGIIAFNSNRVDVVGDTIGLLLQYTDSVKATQYKTNWKIAGPAKYLKEFKNANQVITVFDSAGTYNVYTTTFGPRGRQLAADTTSLEILCEVPPTLKINQQVTDTTYGLFSAVIDGAKPNALYKYHWYVNDIPVTGDSVMETEVLKPNEPNVIKLKVNWPVKKLHCSVDFLEQQLEIQPPYQLAVTGNPQAPLTLAKQYNWSNILLGFGGMFLLPLLTAFVVWWRFIKAKPANKSKADKPGPEELKGPFIIEFNNHQDKIMPETGISQLAEVLRKRHTTDIYKIDIHKTINKTIRQGGFPQLQYAPRTQPTDFLILLDKEYPEGHLTRLFAYVIDRLKKEQVHLTVYTFSREPLLLSNEGLNQVLLPIDKVARLYPDTMLIIFSQAKAFFKSYDVVLKNWVTEKFKSWDTKLLLTPLTKKDWGAEELALYQAGFTVVPADMNSFSLISDEINHMIDRQILKKQIVPETYGSRQFNFNRWRQVSAYLTKALTENKRQFNHLSDANLIEQWLCALAIYPHINWQVTIAIGKAFEDKYSGSGRLVNYTNLLVISRISWMNDDQLMDSLRVEMLNKLEPDKEALARQVIVGLMKEIEPAIPADSLVRNEFDFLHTTNKVLLNASDQQQQTITAKEWEQFKGYVDSDQVDWTLQTYLQQGKQTLLTDPENPARNLPLDAYIKAKERQGNAGLTEEEKPPAERLKKLFKNALPVLSFLLIAIFSYFLLQANNRLQFLKVNKISTLLFSVEVSNLSPFANVNSLAVMQAGKVLPGTSIGNNTYQVLNVPVTDTSSKATLQVGIPSGNIESDFALKSSRYNVAVQLKRPDTSRVKNEFEKIDLPQAFNEIWQLFDSSGKFVSQLAFYLKPRLVFSKNDPKSSIDQSTFIEAAQIDSKTYKVILYSDKKYEVAFFRTVAPDVLKLIFCMAELSSFDSLNEARKVRLPRCKEDLTLKPLYLPVVGLKSDANALSVQLPQNGTNLYSSEQRKFELALRRFNTLSPNDKQLVTVSISLNGFYKFTADVQQRQAAIKQSTLGKAFGRARWLYKPFNGNAFQRDYVTVDFGGSISGSNTPPSKLSDQQLKIYNKIKQIIVDKLGVKPDEVTTNSSFVNDLGADDLDIVELTMEFEKEYNIAIRDDEVKKTKTVLQAVNLIDKIVNSVYGQNPVQQNQNAQQQQSVPDQNNALASVIKAALSQVNLSGNDQNDQAHDFSSQAGLGSNGTGKGAFVYWCYNSYPGGNPLLKSASGISIWNALPSRYKLSAGQAQKEPNKIIPGNIFFISEAKGGGIGIVVSVNNGQIETIESEPWPNPSRLINPEKVVQKSRKISEINLGFSNFGNNVSAPKSAAK